MDFHDRASLEKVRRLSDGRLSAVARFARSGVQQYSGREVGRPDLAIVNVYRPEEEVFAEDAMASFAHKAVTIDHPGEPVNASNWKKVAVGYSGDRVARDGGFVEIPLMLADAEAVAGVESGATRQLSAAYSCDLIWGDGVSPTGERYQAKQTRIRGDSIALVPQGRAGPECRIGDAKSTGPASIDEALRERFAEMAKQQHTTVREMLASMEQKKIEEIAMEVSRSFVSAQAGQGVASTYATDAAMLTDAERDWAKSKAVRDHAMRHAYMAAPPPFTAADEAAAIASAARQKAAVSNSKAQMVADTADARRAMRAAHDAYKADLSTAWMRKSR